MSDIQMTPIGLQAGMWCARLVAVAEPQVDVTHDGAVLQGAEVQADGDGAWLMRVPVPQDTLSDGLQTYLVTDRDTGAKLGHFTILAGEILDDDLRAEVALLRAELDLLKKAFRRLAGGS